MRERVEEVVAASGTRGDIERVRRLLGAARERHEADAVVLIGDLSLRGEAEEYAGILRVLGEANIPAFYVPGPGDAPFGRYLREVYNAEVVFPFLHGVHGSFAFGPGYVLFAGMGGEVVDGARPEREEESGLRYPGWEVEYRLKVLHELRDYQRVFLFGTPPAHKGFGEGGSQTLAELVKTHSPRVVFAGGEDFACEELGSSLVVSPGALSEGRYAVVRITGREARAHEL
ncbi:heat-stable protein [Rubrobacter xylanophilus]|uniref:Heat-stable protein n=1 Tax=Rubrobacter xylanophilus TaxID=49319 RepID=A0A510HKC4_9ACTN|nr:metallophosphoesterase [Rubrobacter xylanophilus]BBL78797.1 heat-stable protein [Rubrobacter xylanophilus]